MESINVTELSQEELKNTNGGIIIGLIVNTICGGILLAPIVGAAVMGWNAYKEE